MFHGAARLLVPTSWNESTLSFQSGTWKPSLSLPRGPSQQEHLRLRVQTKQKGKAAGALTGSSGQRKGCGTQNPRAPKKGLRPAAQRLASPRPARMNGKRANQPAGSATLSTRSPSLPGASLPSRRRANAAGYSPLAQLSSVSRDRSTSSRAQIAEL